MTKKEASVSELKTHLSEYLREVQEGRAVAITSHGRQIASLEPVPKPAPSITITPPEKTGLEWNSIRPIKLRRKPSEDPVEALLEDRRRR